MPTPFCRVCLAANLRMYDIEDINLLQIYEQLASTTLKTDDGRPRSLCYVCYWQLRRCGQFSAAARRAEGLLAGLLRASNEVSLEKVTKLNPSTQATLSTTTPQHLSVENYPDDVTTADNVRVFVWEYPTVKEEPQEMKEELVAQEIYIEVERVDNEQFMAEHETSSLHSEAINYNLNDFVNSTISTLYNDAINAGYNLDVNNSMVNSDADTSCNEPIPYSCISCGKRFSLKRYLKSHMLVHTGEKKFACPVPECHKTFARKSDLNRHIKSHTEDNVEEIAEVHHCEVCGRAFKNRTSVVSHMRTHTGVRPYSCPHCGSAFRFECNLQAHIKMHSGEKAFSCSECGKGFAAKGNLAQHMRTHRKEPLVKTEEQLNHVCSICDKAFSRAAYLTRHLRRHTGERPFGCSCCEKSYSDSGSLHIHMRVHTGERPYACSTCGRAFARSHQLKQHLAAAKCRP